MKASTLGSMKFFKLQAKLNTPFRGDVIGILEALWQFAAANAITGAIGKFTDEEITAWMGCRMFDRSPREFIELLVECGWIDVHPVHRLVIHDWHDHCASFIKGNLATHGKLFANLADDDPRQPQHSAKQAAKQVARQAAKQVAKQPAKQVAKGGLGVATYPIQSNPILSPPPPTPPQTSDTTRSVPVEEEEEGDGSLTWTNIAARLSECGVVASRNAIERCKQAGGTPAFAAALIEHWASRPGAWTVGLLAHRIEQGPAVEVTQGWPEPAAAAVKATADTKKQAVATQAQEDAQFATLVKTGRQKGVSDERIIAVAVSRGLREAAIRANWKIPDEKPAAAAESSQTAQVSDSG